MIQDDDHLLTVLRYIEANPFTAAGKPLAQGGKDITRIALGRVQHSGLAARYRADIMAA